MPKRNGPGIELLADPTRRRIIAVLALRPRRSSAVATEIGLSRAATSRQLHLMQEAGLIEVRHPYHDRRARMFAINPKAHGQITAWLAGTEIGRPAIGPTIDPDSIPALRKLTGPPSRSDFSGPVDDYPLDGDRLDR